MLETELTVTGNREVLLKKKYFENSEFFHWKQKNRNEHFDGILKIDMTLMLVEQLTYNEKKKEILNIFAKKMQ